MTLKKHIDRIISLTNELDPSITWKSIQIVKDVVVNPGIQTVDLSKAVFFSMEEFETEFNQLILKGYSWINFNVLGKLDNALIISVELPASICFLPPESTPINLSGPFNFIKTTPNWDLNKIRPDIYAYLKARWRYILYISVVHCYVLYFVTSIISIISEDEKPIFLLKVFYYLIWVTSAPVLLVGQLENEYLNYFTFVKNVLVIGFLFAQYTFLVSLYYYLSKKLRSRI